MTPGPALDGLGRDQLARLAPEYLLAGHLIDRAGMPHLIGAFGRDGMRDIAIEEWRGASPVYTRRMQRALGFEGDSVETIFKGMQIDVGAPPQFMDFRYVVTDHDHGEFCLDHCGALMDVEPMGPDYVTAMCHDIEDPTFDATATASNPRAQVRPIHRPPRVPADRSPHCAWTVTIAADHPALPVPDEARAMSATRAATLELRPDRPGRPRPPRLRRTARARSRLRRLVGLRTPPDRRRGLPAGAPARPVLPRRGGRPDADARGRRRLRSAPVHRRGRRGRRAVPRRARTFPPPWPGRPPCSALHPGLLPYAYVGCDVDLDERLVVRIGRDTGAAADGAWPSMLDADHLGPLDAIVRASTTTCTASRCPTTTTGWSSRSSAVPRPCPSRVTWP